MRWRGWMAALIAGLALAGVSVPAAGNTRLSDLPLTEDRAAGAGDTLVVFYSGDGGWATIDRQVAQGLVQAGLPVVGYNSLRYFWTARTPAGAAADLATVLRHYMTAWGKTRIVLVGYSFGADALPRIVPRLPADLRAHVRLVALVGAGREGELEFHPSEWLRLTQPSDYSVAANLPALKGTPMVCIYGDREPSPACPAFPVALIHRVRLAGDHHYGGDYAALTRALVQALPK